MTCANQSPPLGLSLTNFTVANGVKSLGLGVGVGSPAQYISLWPSTADDVTWLNNAENCDGGGDLQCYGEDAGAFNSSASTTYSGSTLQTWNGTGLTQLTANQLNNLVYFNDKITFGRNGSVSGLPFIMEKKGQTGSSGLGLGVNSTFLNQAVNDGSAPTKNWGLWVGSQSVAQPVDGALWIGGYDTYRTTDTFTNFQSNPNDNNCMTCTLVTGLDYVSSSGTTSLFSNTSQTIQVILQPWTSYLSVSSDIYGNFVKIMQNQNVFSSYVNSVPTYKNNVPLGNISVTMQVTPGNYYKTVIPASEFFIPPRDTDKNGDLYISNNTYNLAMLYNVSASSQYVFDWGWPFLTMNYLAMDYDAKQFKLAPARRGPLTQSNGPLVQPLCSGLAATTVKPDTPASASSSAATSSSGVPSTGKSTPVGAIAGGVVGGVAVILIVAGLIWFLMRGKKREKKLRDERDAAVAGGSEMGQRQEVLSQYTATSPTEVSEVYAGGKAYGSNSINQWLHTQNQHHSTLEPVNPSTTNPGPGSPTFSNAQPSHISHASQTSATMNEPFEMPAYKYT